MSVSDWFDLDGKKQPWDSVPLHLSAIVSLTSINQWKPTSEEYEGYTGNAGNSVDRWYHRSAIVLWPRSHHYDIIAQSGADASIPLLQTMMAKLAKTPKTRFEAARQDCLLFASAIIERWPTRRVSSFGSRPAENRIYEDFAARLASLNDLDAVSRFLTIVAERDEAVPLDSLITAACRDFGWRTFADVRRRLIATKWGTFQERGCAARP